MQTVYDNTKEKMEKTLTALSKEFAALRAGRASAAILDKLSVDYYGVPTPINQMAAVSVAEARILTIQPWDASTIGEIEKAIQQSDIGINPQSDGKLIRLNFPPLTEDKRKELAKNVGKLAETAKVAIRSVRRDSIEKLKNMKKQSEITEDDLKDGENELQKITDGFIKQIDEMSAKKEKEIMEI